MAALANTLTDTFDTNVLNAGLWSTANASDPTQVKVQNNRLEITHTALSQYNALESLTTYDLTGNSSFVQIIDRGNQALVSHEVIFYARIDLNNKVWFSCNQNTLNAWKLVATVQTQVGSGIAYDANTMKYLRLREAGGTTFWDTSPDAINWTNRWSATNPIIVTGLLIGCQTGCFSNEASSSQGFFDNVSYLSTATYDPLRVPNPRVGPPALRQVFRQPYTPVPVTPDSTTAPFDPIYVPVRLANPRVGPPVLRRNFRYPYTPTPVDPSPPPGATAPDSAYADILRVPNPNVGPPALRRQFRFPYVAPPLTPGPQQAPSDAFYTPVQIASRYVGPPALRRRFRQPQNTTTAATVAGPATLKAVSGVARVSISKISGVANAAISKVGGVLDA